MSCLDEQEVTVVIELPEWHEFETWYESRTGQSSFMQLCRVINYLLGIYDRELIDFYRVGSNPGDTDFAAVAYDANATWNPLYDIQVILTQCRQAILDILNAEEPSVADCTVRMPTDRSSIIATYNAATTGLNLALKEDWLPLLTAMRNALEGISISTQTILAMDEVHLSISTGGSATSDNILKSHIGLNEPSCLAEGYAPTGYVHWVVEFGGTLEKNPYSARESSCGLETEISNFAMGVGKGVGAYFRFTDTIVYAGDGSYAWTIWAGDTLPDGTPFCESLIGGESGVTLNGAAGWVEQYELTTAFYVSRASFSDNAMAATDGLTVEWYITKSNPDIGCTFSPASGSFAWGIGEEIKRIEVVTTLTDANITDSEWPDTPTLCVPVFNLVQSFHAVCQNACGDYVNPS